MLIPLGILSSSGAAPGDYELIATAFGTGSSAIITFSSIGAEYKHLQLRYTARSSTTNGRTVDINFNGSTATVYNNHILRSDGTRTAVTSTGSNTSIALSNFFAGSGSGSRFAAGIVDILDYADTSKGKTIKTNYGFMDLAASSPPGAISTASGMFNDTSAITSITLTASSNIQSPSRFSLYGIKG